MDSVIPALAIVGIILLFPEAFRIAVRGFLINYQVDFNQVDEWLQIIQSLGC